MRQLARWFRLGRGLMNPARPTASPRPLDRRTPRPGQPALEALEDRLTPAAITSIEPTENAGEFFTIRGSGFQTPAPATRVLFTGGVAASFFSVVDDTKIEAQVPLGKTAAQLNGPVTVEAPSGNATSADAFSLEVLPSADTSYVAWLDNGINFVVDGRNLGTTTRVVTSSSVELPFTVVNDSRLLIPVTPALANEDLTITTAAGEFRIRVRFDYLAVLNGIPPGQVGQFDIAYPLDDTSSYYSYGTYAGARGRTFILDSDSSGDFLYDLNYYIDRGPSLTVESLANIGTVDSPVALIGPNTLQASGHFVGSLGNDISWTATSTIPAGSQKFVTTLQFSAAGGTFGDLKVRSRFVADVDDDSYDEFVTPLGTPGASDFLLLTLDPLERVGYGQGGAYSAADGLVNATYDGFAIADYNMLRNHIFGRTQAFSVTVNPGADHTAFNIDTDETPPQSDPDFGTVYTDNLPGNTSSDAGSAMSWTVSPTASQATVVLFLRNAAANPARPLVTGFTPTTGGPGVTVEVTGTELTGATAVTIGGVPVTSFIVNSATRITAVVAAGASGRVAVTTPGGTTESQQDFTFDTPLTVSGVAFVDADGDHQLGAADGRLAGAVVELFTSTDVTVGNADDVSLGTAVTAADGTYSLTVPSPGNLYARVRVARGYAFTTQGRGSAVDATGTTNLFTAPGGGSTTLNAGVTGTPASAQALTVGGSGGDSMNAVARDAAGNLYVLGTVTGAVDLDPGPGATSPAGAGSDDVFVAKYTPEGSLVWARRVGGPGRDTGLAIALDGAGQVVVVGSGTGTISFGSGVTLTGNPGSRAFVWKLDAAGNTVWARATQSTVDFFQRGTGVAVDGAGNVVVVGSFTDTSSFDDGSGPLDLTSAGNTDIFLWKLTPAGTTVWVRGAGGILGDSVQGVAVDAAGNIVATGAFGDTVTFGGTTLTSTGSLDAYVWKLDPAGATLFVRQAGGAGTVSGLAVTTSGSGTIHVVGAFNGTATFGGSASATSQGDADAFVWKLNPGGATEWVAAGGGTGYEGANAVAVDAAGNAYVTGYLDSPTATFGAGPGAGPVTFSGGSAPFVWKLDPGGATTRAQVIAGAGFNEGLGIAADGASNAIVVGYFEQTINLDPTPGGSLPVTSAGSIDGFLAVVPAPFTPSGTYAVDDSSDIDDGDYRPGRLSLREALVLANRTPGAETLVLPAGTITLTSGEFVISDALTLTGPGAGLLTIDAGGLSRHFTVTSGVAVTLTGLTLTGGQSSGSGGSIANQGDLTLAGVLLAGNSAAGSGGAVANTGTLAATGSTFRDNTAAGGGALANLGGTATVGAATFAGNSATGLGGAIFNTGTLNVAGSTISGNSARFGGGIGLDSASLGLTGTIVAGNTASDSGADINGGSVTAGGGFNLIGDAASAGGLTNGVNGNLVGVDPLLAPLGDYGGGVLTFALLPGSPAIDAGTGIGTDPDARGVAALGRRDIGSFESQGFTAAPTGGALGQSAALGGAFSQPLTVRVTANDPREPVAGGVVTFAAPASGPSATLSATRVTVGADGTASVTATANAVTGNYAVTASGGGLAAPVSFSLANGVDLPSAPVTPPAPTPDTPPISAPTDGPVTNFTPVPLDAVSFALTQYTVATFNAPPGRAGSFTVTIDWGDGTTTLGEVVETAPGVYAVLGRHAYADVGQASVTVALSRDGVSLDPVSAPAAWGYSRLPDGSAPSDAARFVLALYGQLLGRAVSAAEVQAGFFGYWVGLLEARNRDGSPVHTREDVVALFAAQPERLQVVINDLFQRHLGRDADDVGLAFFTALLQAGTSVDRVEALILASDENLAGAAGADALDALYRDLFGRSVDPTGRAVWGARLAGGASPADIALALVTSDEAHARFLDGVYADVLGRPTDSAADFWLAELGRGGDREDVLAGIVGDSVFGEFYDRVTR